MLSDLIKDAVDTLTKHGDLPVVADVLTENQSNLFDICHGLDAINQICHLTLDLNDFTVSEIRKKIK
jgi:hypothetical protein